MPAYPAPPLSHSAGAPMSLEDGAPKPITPRRTAFAIPFTMRPTSSYLFCHLLLAGLIRAARSLFRFISCACSHNLPTTENNHTKSPFTQSRAHAAPRPSHTQEWEVGKVRSGCFPTSHSSVPSFRAAPFQSIYHHSRGRGSTPNASTICRTGPRVVPPRGTGPSNCPASLTSV